MGMLLWRGGGGGEGERRGRWGSPLGSALGHFWGLISNATLASCLTTGARETI